MEWWNLDWEREGHASACPGRADARPSQECPLTVFPYSSIPIFQYSSLVTCSFIPAPPGAVAYQAIMEQTRMKKSEPPHAWVTARMCPERSESVVPSQVAPKYNEASHAGPRQKSSSNVVAGKRATIVYNRQKTHAVTNIRLLFGVCFCKTMNTRSAQRLLFISFSPLERHHDAIPESTLQHKVIVFYLRAHPLLIDLGKTAGRIGVPACSVSGQHLSKRLSDRKPHTPGPSLYRRGRLYAQVSPLLHIKAEIAYRIARTDIFDNFTCPGDVIRNASL